MQVIQQSVKELSKEAIKETTKQVITKGAIIASQEGTEEII